MGKTPERKLQWAADYRKRMRETDPTWQARQKEYQDSYREQNRERIRTQQRSNYERNARKFVLKRHGLTETEYRQMESEQHGCCLICGSPPAGRWSRLCVDHDHATGEVRGLLCDTCNRGLGHLGDSVESLERALGYLKRFEKREA